MKVGVNLLNFGPAVSPDSLVRWATLVESMGYHFAMISDHVAITADVEERYPAPFYDPFTALTWVAAQTRRLELGTTVIVLPYRHPLLTARMAANLDRLSGGRFILGVGAGWARQEFEALGVPFERRGAMTDDYLAAIKTAWTQPVATHQGPFAAFREVRTGPPPFRLPHPPIWVGGSSDGALRRAARHADAWHPVRSRVAWLRSDGLPRLRAAAAREGRAVPALCPRIRLRLTDAPLPDDVRLAGEGTLDQMRRDLAALEELGATHVLLDSYADDPEATRNHEAAWGMLAVLAERAFDLAKESLR